MKKAIVTGANGFIGSWLIKELLKNNVEVIAVVRNEKSNIESIANIEGLRIVYCDLNEIQILPEKIADRDIDVFYHLAWSGSVDVNRIDEKLQMHNALWTVDAVRVASELKCKRFIGAGSIMEKETIAAVYAQENRPGMAYIYGTGKLTAHCISKSVTAQIGLDHIWAIITNAYGVGEISPRFVNTSIRKIINNEPLQFTVATQNYDFIYVTDVAKSLYAIGLKGKPFCEYIIGSSEAKPLRLYIEELQKTLAPNREFLFGDVPFTGINMPLETFITTNTERDTGFKATTSLIDGVKMTMEWLKKP